MDRDSALQAARERFEQPIWSLLSELEETLRGLADVEHFDLGDSRAVGCVLNSALPDAANSAGLDVDLLQITHCRDGNSNKISGSITHDGEAHSVSFELHLCGPRGGTSKASHQFAGYDIEREPTFPGFETLAPPTLLLFIACHLSGTGVKIERAYLKFADGVDQRKVEILRDSHRDAANVSVVGPAEGPEGAKLRVKITEGDKKNHGSESDKRRDAASRSKEA